MTHAAGWAITIGWSRPWRPAHFSELMRIGPRVFSELDDLHASILKYSSAQVSA
jgi:hypothetical protein